MDPDAVLRTIDDAVRAGDFEGANEASGDLSDWLERDGMAQRIEDHGRNLLAIFPDATERDPVKLCKRLRRLEARAHQHAERLCSDAAYANSSQARHDAVERDIRQRLRALLEPDPDAPKGSRVPVLINRDPRGYALKIDDQWLRESGRTLFTDWGGYGILAPDLREGA